jgi:2-octaprenylphenol hydroxylase
MSKHYDIVILGGGMVGSLLASSIALKSDLKIALIEHQTSVPLSELDPPELRVSALTKASVALLKDVGIWSYLIQQRISMFTGMHVWETKQSEIHFDCEEIGEPLLGYIIENRNIQQAGLLRCMDFSNIEIIRPASPTALSDHGLELDNGQSVTADLIIGADGARSQLREWLGIEFEGWDYDQTAIVCSVQTELSHERTAWQRFLSEGPLAFLPLNNEHHASIVWSNSHDEAKLLLTLPDDEFKLALSNAFENKLGTVLDVSARAEFPLRLRHAKTYVQEGYALVGDAAHTIHPLAGQGVNIGFLDAKALADIVLTAHHSNRQIGSLHTLKKYQRKRKADNLAMQLSMDAFERTFGSDIEPIRWARRFGLRQVEQSTFLKSLIMQNASGYRLFD